MTYRPEGRSRPDHTPGGSPHDYNVWMHVIAELDDHEVDALFEGVAPSDELAPVADVVRALRRRVAAEPAPRMSAALRAQIAAPVVVPIHAHRAARGSLVKAAIAAAVVLVALLGAGAAQNRLPSGLQDVVSETAEIFGIDVPRSDERGPDTEPSGSEQGDPGHEGLTPGGATPADPGTPGDHEPATPATPPDNGQGNGPGANSGSPPGENSGQGVGPDENRGSPPGQNSGQGVAPSGSGGSPPGQNSGQGNGPDASSGSPPGQNSGQGNGPGQSSGKGNPQG